MAVRISQPAGFPAGAAKLAVTGFGAADLGALEVCLSGIVDNMEKHLDPRLASDAWTTTIAWFPPSNPRIEGDGLAFELPPAVTWHLRPHAPYVLRLRDASGVRREERLTWVPIRLPSQAPRGFASPAGPGPAARTVAAAEANGGSSDTVHAATGNGNTSTKDAVVEALARQLQEQASSGASGTAPGWEQAAAQGAAAEKSAFELVVASEDSKGAGALTPTRKRFVLPAALLAVLLLVGVGVWFYRDSLFSHDAGPEAESGTAAVSPPPVIPVTLDGARQFLARDPGADESFGQAERFREAKQLDGAFLLLRHAANKGSAPAALALGEMYDPATFSPETSALPAPNPAQAAEWYQKAAEAGLAEAQYRLGTLLLSGKTDAPDAPEVGAAWLRRAADQGHAGAQQALPK